MKHVTHSDRQICFEETGSGEPVVLLPPGASPAVVWKDVAVILGARFRCLAVNFSGYGGTESFCKTRPMRLDDEVEAVFAVAEKFSKTVYIVGHSYGGAVALRCCLNRPQRVRTLTLIEPATYPILDESGDDELSAEVNRVNSEFVTRADAGEFEPAFRSYYNYYNQSQDGWDNLPERLRAGLLSASSTVAVGLKAIHASPTTLADCARIAHPTLLLRGERTDPVHGTLTDLLASTIPGAKRHIVREAGHMLTLTHAREVADAIETHALER